jgi:hypothetical protein
MELAAIMLNELNLISAMTLVHTSMEEASVFISFNCCPDFTPLLSKSELGMRDPAENFDNQGPKI